MPNVVNDQEVRYTLSLKDLLTGKIQNADHAINKLEGSVSSAGAKLKQFGMLAAGALGIGVGIEIFSMAREGLEKLHELHQAEAQVRAGLESTRGVAGLTFEALEKGAKDFAAVLPYSRAQITDMQAQLLTFPSITKDTFGEASQNILDMATRLHKGLDETAIMVGKALQDPQKGITALRRVGVNFNEEQTKIIKKLAETGHAAQAQAMILKELQTEFAGSAKAAADADPLFRYHKLMGQLKMSIGEVAMKLLHELTPALEAVARFGKASVQWMKDHAGLLKAIAIGIGVAALAYTGYLTVIGALIVVEKVKATWDLIQIASLYTTAGAAGTLSGVMTLLTGTWWMLNAAMAANPIGFIIVGIAALTAAVVYCWNKFEGFRGFIYGMWAALKEFAYFIVATPGRVLREFAEAIVNVFHPAKMIEHLKNAANVVFDGAKQIATSFGKGYEEGVASFKGDHRPEEGQLGVSSVSKAGLLGKKTLSTDIKKETAPKATAARSVNIKISINQVVGSIVNKMTTVKESMKNMQDQVTSALLTSINNAQIVAGE